MELVSMSRTAKLVFLAIIILIVGFVLVKIFVKTCPDSCDDFNICTQDVCGSETDRECQHVPIKGPVVGCSSEVSGCQQKGCNQGGCGFVYVDDCCGNNICERNENIETCSKDCMADLTKHFNNVNKGSPTVNSWSTKGFRFTFNNIGLQSEKNDCLLRFKTSEADVIVDINGNKDNFKTKSGWNDYKFVCSALKGNQDIVTISSSDDIQTYFEQVNITGNSLDQYTTDGINWVDHQYDIAVDIFEIRYMLW
jgi:hypothetical protein